MDSLGLVEVVGFSTAVYVADTMVKTADVTIDRLERTKGAGWMTIYVTGDVGAVNAAVAAGEDAATQKQRFVTSRIIARPVSDLAEFIKPKTVAKVTSAPVQPVSEKAAPVVKNTTKKNTNKKKK